MKPEVDSEANSRHPKSPQQISEGLFKSDVAKGDSQPDVTPIGEFGKIDKTQ